jgi:hypothetical protein
MTLDDLWDDVRELTAKLSDVSRQAAYAGLAVVWIFKTGDPSRYHLARSLLWAGALFALALGFDVAQYAYAAVHKWINARHEETVRGVNYKGKDITLPKTILYVPYALFALKVATVAVGFVIMLSYLFQVLAA